MAQKWNLFLILILTSLLLLISSPIVSAQNVSFSTLGQLGAEDILIYEYNGTAQTLYGQWNTSNPYVPLPVNDFNIIVRPSAQGRFSNPETFLADGFVWIETNALQLVVILFLVGLVLKSK